MSNEVENTLAAIDRLSDDMFRFPTGDYVKGADLKALADSHMRLLRFVKDQGEWIRFRGGMDGDSAQLWIQDSAPLIEEAEKM